MTHINFYNGDEKKIGFLCFHLHQTIFSSDEIIIRLWITSVLGIIYVIFVVKSFALGAPFIIMDRPKSHDG